ncbi:S8 family serine peptidase [Dactylosporangium sp. CA-139114]|uniref:S8 family serine peptidase n=1 Tax=Dactylosporangium sp. CA-139114 TaxID=3239931 RepID=UPI003D95373E
MTESRLPRRTSMTRIAVISAVASALVAAGTTAAFAAPEKQGTAGPAGKKTPSHELDFTSDVSGQKVKAPTVSGKFRSGGAGAVANDYIVVLKNGKATQDQVTASAAALTKAHNGKVGKVWSKSVHGFTTTMSEADARKLSTEADVAYVEQNTRIQRADVQNTWPSVQDWNLWGLDRIDQAFQPLDHRYTYPAAGSGVTVYVIDSGVNAGHSEFAGNPGFKHPWSAVWKDDQKAECGTPAAGADDNGHGTFVAGEIAGSTYGVAKRVAIESVKVLDCNGNGYADQLIAGINYVTENAVKPAVANVSIGSRTTSQAVDDAMRASIASGITYAVAANNDNVDACTQSPSRVQEAIVVGATDETDFRASFSNYGPCVDLFAPGARIQSAYYDLSQGSQSAFASGTSMAAPLVAGDAALLLQAHPDWTPAQVQAAILKAGVSGTVHAAGPGSPTKLLRVGEPAAVTSQQFGLRARANGLVVTAESAGNQPMTANRFNTGAWEGITVVDAGGGLVGLLSSASNKYITAESGGAAPLIANRASIGAWEKFRLVNNADGSVSFKAEVNGKFVAADLNNGGKLIANRDAAGPWETFDFAGAATTVVLWANANGYFVTAESGGNSPLIANRGSIGQWEQFDVVDGGGYAAFVAHANNKLVTADLNNGGKLIANRTAIGAWERFSPNAAGVFVSGFYANANGRYVTADLNNAGTLTANRTAVGAWEVFQVINVGEVF